MSQCTIIQLRGRCHNARYALEGAVNSPELSAPCCATNTGTTQYELTALYVATPRAVEWTVPVVAHQSAVS